MASEILAGSIVSLKSGGPRMTVDGIRPAADGTVSYECMWMADGVIQKHAFGLHLLDVHEDEPAHWDGYGAYQVPVAPIQQRPGFEGGVVQPTQDEIDRRNAEVEAAYASRRVNRTGPIADSVPNHVAGDLRAMDEDDVHERGAE